MSDYFVEGVRAAQEGLKLSDNPYLLKAREWDGGFRTTVGLKPQKHGCKCDGRCKERREQEFDEPTKVQQEQKVTVDDRDTTIIVNSANEEGKLWPVFAWIAAALGAAIGCYFVVQWALQ